MEGNRDDVEERLSRLEQENTILRETIASHSRRLDALESRSSSGKSPVQVARARPSTARTPSEKTTGATRSGKKVTPLKSIVTPGEDGRSTTRLNSKTSARGDATGKTASPGDTKKLSSRPATSPQIGRPKRSLGGGQAKRSGPVLSQPRTVSSEDNSIKLYLRGRPIILYAPTGVDISEVDQALPPPQQKLHLEWVYGYRGKDCRSNLFLLPSGEVLYFIAAVAVVYNPEAGTQTHFTGHNDDIKSMAVHPNMKIIATGQVASLDKEMGKPHVLVWDLETLEIKSVIGLREFDRSVSCLAFSVDGEMLLAIDESNEHTMSIWDWRKKRKMQETRTHGDPVLGAMFHPASEKLAIVSYGKQHVCFWSSGDDGKLQKKMGLFEKHTKPKFITSAIFSENGDLITGDSNGTLFLWASSDHKIKQEVKAHEGAVFGLTYLRDGSLLSGGGKDRRLIVWDKTLTKTGKEQELPEDAGGVRTIVETESGRLLVGTTANSIYEGSLDSAFREQIKGHSDELWGLASSPVNNHFVSCGNDRLVCVWDAMTHSTLWSTIVSDAAVCAAFHPSGSVVAVGLQTGRWLVFDSVTGTYVASGSDGSEEISVKFSPDGSKMSVASHDNHIYIYTVESEGTAYEKKGRCSGHSSFVTHVDWSTDSQNLQSVSGDYELLYWDMETCKQIPSAVDMKDTKWSSWNCILGFPLAGIWPEGADGTDINAVDRDGAQSLVATADDFGRVNLFSWPCFHAKSECNTGKGHSSHVTCVRFLSDDLTLMSTGGKDTAIMQWGVV